MKRIVLILIGHANGLGTNLLCYLSVTASGISGSNKADVMFDFICASDAFQCEINVLYCVFSGKGQRAKLLTAQICAHIYVCPLTTEFLFECLLYTGLTVAYSRPGPSAGQASVRRD